MSKISQIYGSNVFDKRTMREKLPSATYACLMRTVEQGEPLDLEVANVVAHAMKEWAIEKGATHFTHWFQPLSGVTSEKHDAFLSPEEDGSAITRFSGKELIQGEPDASSFPSGGLRATFEARGYTAWDPTSYAFIKDEVLCIPTAFCSYRGEALDKKTPLLRSMHAVEAQAKRVLALFGEFPERIVTTVGAEQEFFLISERDYAAREDLVLTGRTLFGAPPCKGQELDEHYFGAIRPTVNAFMKELDDELWALGISARTKHNEVAPAQHELAPIFANANRAIDENLLTMEKMRLLASHHGLVCLLHEKPFEGINGSGKHDNWSLAAGDKNLLDPGDNPVENLRFLVFLTAVIEAVDNYQELLRMSVASAGNDHRLGAHEAPPAIVSIFLGDELGAIMESLINGTEYHSAGQVAMDLGVAVLPNFLKDNTDRNRTSPFAFTGNKFEFRMPGSNVNLADANTVLNTAVAKSLKGFADALEDVPTERFESAAIAWVKRSLTDHQRIVFNGNGYAGEWEEEAARRGLANHKTTADALPAYVAPKSIALFEEFGVLNETEVRSRYEVKLDKYIKLLSIECRVMKRMARRTYIPAISRYATETAQNVAALDAIGVDCASQRDLAARLAAGIVEAARATRELDALHKQAEAIDDSQERATFYAHQVVPAMSALRRAIDGLEIITCRDFWPAPSYNNLLFYV
ncbi:glutamine synthetase type III [Berryella wangjianweii]|uniref:Glutamine synthetase type III n=1 Tax=Berryella wangjianweii TaxID=2734634 RepID=A0A6M8J2N8_9ACTN|nr:glutamine synthetase III [Berryella wangjianweii]QKF06903.1 glutamine synthetase type III [Berryella wangjianweii]